MGDTTAKNNLWEYAEPHPVFVMQDSKADLRDKHDVAIDQGIVTRLAKCVAATLLLSACGKSEPPVVPSPTSPPANASAVAALDAEALSTDDGNLNRLVRISRFDCVASDEPSAAGGFPWAKGISLWSGGGPGGAAWNTDKLRCAVEVASRCAKGEADIELRIGGTLSGSQRIKMGGAGVQQAMFDLTAEQWDQHFDQGSPLTARFPYETATFSASATASCEAADAFGPGTGPRLEFADDRHFTAGFAGGE